MNDKDIEATIDLAIREILTVIRSSSTATSEVSGEQNMTSIETIINKREIESLRYNIIWKFTVKNNIIDK